MMAVSEVLQWRAPRLKAHFQVYGSYYDYLFRGRCFPCRATLELVAATERQPRFDMNRSRPDLLVVMLNPGASRPLDKSFRPPEVTCSDAIGELSEGVPAMPDTTQYQIMRLMLACGFRHARILNLSDLRTPKSGVLLQEIGNLSGRHGEWHSVFGETRREELQRRLPGEGSVPAVLGWGRFPAMRPWALRCLEYLRHWQCYGLPVDQDPVLYAHPSPMLQSLKDRWLQTVIRQIRGSDEYA